MMTINRPIKTLVATHSDLRSLKISDDENTLTKNKRLGKYSTFSNSNQHFLNSGRSEICLEKNVQISSKSLNITFSGQVS